MGRGGADPPSGTPLELRAREERGPDTRGRDFWDALAGRLATEFGDALLRVVEAWTGAAAGGELEHLDRLRAEVEAVGFLVGCLGAGRGSDALRERREVELVTRVLVALRGPLAERRAVHLSVTGELPLFTPAAADWRRALSVAWAAWRTRDAGAVEVSVLRRPGGVRLRVGSGVAWDDDLATAFPAGLGVALAEDGLDLADSILAGTRR